MVHNLTISKHRIHYLKSQISNIYRHKSSTIMWQLKIHRNKAHKNPLKYTKLSSTLILFLKHKEKDSSIIFLQFYVT